MFHSFPGLMLTFMILGAIAAVAAAVQGQLAAAAVGVAFAVVGFLGWRVRGRDDA